MGYAAGGREGAATGGRVGPVREEECGWAACGVGQPGREERGKGRASSCAGLKRVEKKFFK